MKVYYAGQREGKTTFAINWLFEDIDHRMLIVANRARVEVLMHEIIRTRIHPNHELYQDPKWLSDRYWTDKIGAAGTTTYPTLVGRRDIREVLIDDVDDVIASVLGIPWGANNIYATATTGTIELIPLNVAMDEEGKKLSEN